MKRESEFIAIYICGLPGELCGHNDRMTAREVASKIMWKEETAKQGFLGCAHKLKTGQFYQATPAVTIVCVYHGSSRKHDPEVLETCDDLLEMLDEYNEHGMISGSDHYIDKIKELRKKFQ